MVPGLIPTTHVLELQAIWLGLKAFSQRVENARVALMSYNTSAVAYLRNQGGKYFQMNDLATYSLWAEKRGMKLVPHHLPGHLNVLADIMSQRGQILKTEWNLHQTGFFVPGADHSWICSPWGETQIWQRTSPSIRRRSRGKWRVLSIAGAACTLMCTHRQAFAETAQADLLTPLSSASVESQPTRLEIIKGFHKERGFSEAVAQRLAIPVSSLCLKLRHVHLSVTGVLRFCSRKRHVDSRTGPVQCPYGPVRCPYGCLIDPQVCLILLAPYGPKRSNTKSGARTFSIRPAFLFKISYDPRTIGCGRLAASCG